MVVEVKTDGSVVGFIEGTGCKLAGLAMQNVVPTMAQLGVTASGCADDRFNGRYLGMLATNPSSREAKLSLSGVATAPGQGMRIMSVGAVLKR